LEGYEMIRDGNWNYVVPCQQVSSNPERYFKLKEDNSIKMTTIEHYNSRTQDLPDYYYDAGQFGLAKKEYFLSNFKKNKKIIGYILNDYEACDIDNSKDLKKAKFLFKKLKNE
jgi:CMP-N-acetylneuraminic acid synthetase